MLGTTRELAQPSAVKLTVYLWLSTIGVVAALAVVSRWVGVEHLFGELLWLIASPAVVGWAYRKRYQASVPRDAAKRAASYFVGSFLLLGLLVMVVSMVEQQVPLKAPTVAVLVGAIGVYCLVVWFLGRWLVVLGLRSFERELTADAKATSARD